MQFHVGNMLGNWTKCALFFDMLSNYRKLRWSHVVGVSNFLVKQCQFGIHFCKAIDVVGTVVTQGHLPGCMAMNFDQNLMKEEHAP